MNEVLTVTTDDTLTRAQNVRDQDRSVANSELVKQMKRVPVDTEPKKVIDKRTSTKGSVGRKSNGSRAVSRASSRTGSSRSSMKDHVAAKLEADMKLKVLQEKMELVKQAGEAKRKAAAERARRDAEAAAERARMDAEAAAERARVDADAAAIEESLQLQIEYEEAKGAVKLSQALVDLDNEQFIGSDDEEDVGDAPAPHVFNVEAPSTAPKADQMKGGKRRLGTVPPDTKEKDEVKAAARHLEPPQLAPPPSLLPPPPEAHGQRPPQAGHQEPEVSEFTYYPTLGDLHLVGPPEIKPFSGAPGEWMGFVISFNELIASRVTRNSLKCKSCSSS